MTDIVERLSDACYCTSVSWHTCEPCRAAEEIIRLRGLREVVTDLTEIVRMPNAEHIADKHNAAVRRLREELK